MASTPSASALSAVLRCRGNILTRNPPTKRPATAAYSLGLAGGAARDSTSERTRSNQASTWKSFLQGERILVGKGLVIAYKSSGTDDIMLRKKEYREINNSCYPKVSQSRMRAAEDARSPVAAGAQNALVRPPMRKLTSNLPGMEKCFQLIRMIKYEAFAAHIICKTIFFQNITELPTGVLKVSTTSPSAKEKGGQISSFVLSGWTTLKSTCLSLTAKVSEIIFLKLGVLCRSSSHNDAPLEPLLGERDMNVKNVKIGALQVTGPICSPADLCPTEENSSSGQKITEDRPD